MDKELLDNTPTQKELMIPFNTKGEIMFSCKFKDHTYSYFDHWYYFKIDKTKYSTMMTEDFSTFTLHLTPELASFFTGLGYTKTKIDKEEAIELLAIEQEYIKQREVVLHNFNNSFIMNHKKQINET